MSITPRATQVDPASMMGGSWMGSHFTNDDLVKDSWLVEDYDIDPSFFSLRTLQRRR